MLIKRHDKSSPLNSTHYAMLYPQNGDHIVAIDSVTTSPNSFTLYFPPMDRNSLQPFCIYTCKSSYSCAHLSYGTLL